MSFKPHADLRSHSSCALAYDDAEYWICATWQGYAGPLDALQGAEAYLRHAARRPCALLLNDNSQLYGPWFEGTEWLSRVWLPQAERLGLRYVAHVVQADQHHDVIALLEPTALPFELQIFGEVGEAQQWLRECRTTLARGAGQPNATTA